MHAPRQAAHERPGVARREKVEGCARTLSDRPHAHRALDDAVGQGELFCDMLKANRRKGDAWAGKRGGGLTVRVGTRFAAVGDVSPNLSGIRSWPSPRNEARRGS